MSVDRDTAAIGYSVTLTGRMINSADPAIEAQTPYEVSIARRSTTSRKTRDEDERPFLLKGGVPLLNRSEKRKELEGDATSPTSLLVTARGIPSTQKDGPLILACLRLACLTT
jgi:hypothetical protein